MGCDDIIINKLDILPISIFDTIITQNKMRMSANVYSSVCVTNSSVMKDY